MARPYYTLLMRRRPAPGDTQPHLMQWGIEFGDYDREIVEDERNEYKRLFGREMLFKILYSPDARQSTISRLVDELNAAL
jgi:hypothetical protein